MNEETLGIASNWAQIISVGIEIAGIIITTGVAIYLAVWTYRYTQIKRKLTCYFDDIVSPIEIKVGNDVSKQIELHYQGRRISNLFIIKATIKNTGKTSIRDNVIVEPLTLLFGRGTEIIKQPEILNTKPADLRIKCQLLRSPSTSKAHAVRLIVKLLNPGDEFTIELVCTGTVIKPKVLISVEDMQALEIREASELHVNTTQTTLINISLGAALGILLLVAGTFLRGTSLTTEGSGITALEAYSLAFLLGMVTLIMFYFSTRGISLPTIKKSKK